MSKTETFLKNIPVANQYTEKHLENVEILSSNVSEDIIKDLSKTKISTDLKNSLFLINQYFIANKEIKSKNFSKIYGEMKFMA